MSEQESSAAPVSDTHEQQVREACSSCNGTGRWPWMPGQHRNTDDDDQPCADCDGNGWWSPRAPVSDLPGDRHDTLRRLSEAATARLGHGHNDTCSKAMDEAAGPPMQGYPCSCGHDALVAALAVLPTSVREDDYRIESDFPGWADLTTEQKAHVADIEVAAFWRGYSYELPTSVREEEMRPTLLAAIDELTQREIDAPTSSEIIPGPLAYRERVTWADGYTAACDAVRALIAESSAASASVREVLTAPAEQAEMRPVSQATVLPDLPSDERAGGHGGDIPERERAAGNGQQREGSGDQRQEAPVPGVRPEVGSAVPLGRPDVRDGVPVVRLGADDPAVDAAWCIHCGCAEAAHPNAWCPVGNLAYELSAARKEIADLRAALASPAAAPAQERPSDLRATIRSALPPMVGPEGILVGVLVTEAMRDAGCDGEIVIAAMWDLVEAGVLTYGTDAVVRRTESAAQSSPSPVVEDETQERPSIQAQVDRLLAALADTYEPEGVLIYVTNLANKAEALAGGPAASGVGGRGEANGAGDEPATHDHRCVLAAPPGTVFPTAPSCTCHWYRTEANEPVRPTPEETP